MGFGEAFILQQFVLKDRQERVRGTRKRARTVPA